MSINISYFIYIGIYDMTSSHFVYKNLICVSIMLNKWLMNDLINAL